MVAIVIAFPGIVTSHVSKAAGAISGSSTEELRRQLGAPAAPVPKDDAVDAIDRMLKERK